MRGLPACFPRDSLVVPLRYTGSGSLISSEPRLCQLSNSIRICHKIQLPSPVQAHDSGVATMFSIGGRYVVGW